MSNENVDAKVLALLSETPLGVFVDALRTGEIHEPPSDPIAPNETVIGELNDREKALWSAFNLLRKKASEISETNNKTVNEAIQNGVEVNVLEAKLNRLEYDAVGCTLNCLGELMWCFIRKRIGAPAIDCDNVGIRKGYKVVAFPSQHHEIGGITLLKTIFR